MLKIYAEHCILQRYAKNAEMCTRSALNCDRKSAHKNGLKRILCIST